MTWRQQLPIASPMSARALARALFTVVQPTERDAERLTEQLKCTLGVAHVFLLQSGTAALSAAMQLALPTGGVAALPAYGCPDLITAALAAGVRVRLYDIDPTSLAADLASLEGTLRRGAEVVVAAHFFGLPQDVPAIAALAERYGARVIEDAAQGLGGGLRGQPLGSLAPLGVLSFGRGKGVSGGAGGALVLRDHELAEPAAGMMRPLPRHRGARPILASVAQSLIGRPGIYRLPAALPFLHLGEMVYGTPPATERMPDACATLALSNVRGLADVVWARTRVAAQYAKLCRGSAWQPMAALPQSQPSWLRFPLRGPRIVALPVNLGAIRPYPVSVRHQRHANDALCAGEPEQPGALEACRSLVTLPTHHMVDERDVSAIGTWLAHTSRADESIR